MANSYIVCDGKGRMAALEVKIWGKVRVVLAMFADEQDALDVALEVEKISGVPHGVHRIGTTITVDERPYGAENV